MSHYDSPAAYPYDVGSFSRTIRTSVPDCQVWFDRGLTWSYAFHHEESERCFRRAVDLDPGCSMAHWGVAYARGPNYNKEYELFDKDDLKRTLEACQSASAKAKETATTPLETALATAIATRFPVENGLEGGIGTRKDWDRWNRAYSEAMGKVYDEFGHDDLDVAALFADSMMNLAPWQLWDLPTGKPREDIGTLRIQSVLERAIRQPGALEHPGLLHFYIHLMEMSPTPEIALPSADRLRGLVPDGGHLHHMPAHLDLLIGDFRRCIASNFDAIRADEKYMKLTTASDFYTFYRLHDYTFPIYAAMFNGQYRVAIETVDRMELCLTDEVLRHDSPPMINWLENFQVYKVHVLVRFGKWQDILALDFPTDRAFYCVKTTMMHYARGVAYSVLGQVDNSQTELDLFRSTQSVIPPERHATPNTWKDILNVADAMLSGELEYRRGHYAVAFEHLREAIKRSDNLVYAEPWGWMQPPRHAYAALLLEQGRVEDAAQVYAEDLGYDHSLPRAVRHPNNVWALHGYHECLVRLGRTAEAKIIEPQLTLALAVADISVESSCFCRSAAPAADESMKCCPVPQTVSA